MVIFHSYVKYLKISASHRIVPCSLHHAASEVLSGLAVRVTCEHSKENKFTYA